MFTTSAIFFHRILLKMLVPGLLFIACCSTGKAILNSEITIRSVRDASNWGRAAIIGVVYDSTGYAMAGTIVDVLDCSADTTVVTAFTKNGNTFLISDLAPGTYKIRASFIGFKRAVLPALTIRPNTTTVIEIYMNPSPILIH